MSGRISADSDDQGALTLVQRPMRSDTWASASSTRHTVASAHEAIPVSRQAITRWAEYVKALDDEQRKAFVRQMPDGDLVSYAEAVDQVISASVSKSKAARSSKWITPLVDFFNLCKPLTEALSEAYPPARLVLGGVLFALSMTQRVIKYQESLVQFLNKVMSSLGQLEGFRTAFPDTSEIQEALVDVFDIILRICARVSIFFMNSKGKQKSSLRLLPRSFDKDFGEWSQLLDLNLGAFDRTINLMSVKKLGHLQETQIHLRMQLGSYIAFHANATKQAEEERERLMRQIARDQDERRKDILNWLSGLSFQKTHDMIFNAALGETGSWLLSHETYLSWRERSHGSLLWVYGKHGSGKSHLAARVIEELRSFCLDRNRVPSQIDGSSRGRGELETVDTLQADDSAQEPAEPKDCLVLNPQANAMDTTSQAFVGDTKLSTEFTAESNLLSHPTSSQGPGRAAVAYIYCSSELIRTSGNTQGGHLTDSRVRYDTTDLLGSILKQLYRHLPLDEDVPRLRDLCFDAHIEQPSREDIIHGIKSVIPMLAKTFIVVDGLDECSGVATSQFEGLCNLLATFADLGGTGPSANVLLFSRDGYPAISSATDGFPSIEVDRGANIEDINRFIGDRSKQLTKDLASLKEIQDHLLSSADGMFLWVSLVIDSIKKERTARKMKHAALNMPRGLSGAYAGALKRILIKEEPARSLALRALLWITNSKRPLNKPQLLEVLALEEGMSSIDDDERLDPDIPLTTDCADLLVLKDSHYTLLHASLGDFLRSLSEEPIEGLDGYRDLQVRAHQLLAEDCITFLNFDVFEIGPMSSQDALEELFQKHPFLEYAGLFWGHHLREALDSGSDGLRAVACGLLRATDTRRLLHQIYIRDLSNRGVDVNPFPFPPDTTPLHLLSIFGLNALLSAFSPDEVDVRQTDGFGYWPIDHASANGHKAMCSWILDRHRAGDLDKNQENEKLCRSSTWLVGACIRNHWTDLLSLVLVMGHSATEGTRGSTAIDLAASLGHADIVEHLLLSGAHTDTRDRYTGCSPLISAALNKHVDVMRKLLQHSANASLQAWNGSTALHLVSIDGDVQMATDLLNSGANIEARREEALTPLHDAAANGSEEMVTLLLESGAEKEARTYSGQTPLLLAAQEGRTGALRVLLHFGADIEVLDDVGSNCLHTAARRSQAETMSLLLANPLTARLLNFGDRNRQTPLHVATWNGSTVCARMLLEHGADPEIADIMGWTPLSGALMHENIELAHMLVDGHKVDPKHLTAQGSTYMHMLALGDRAEHIHTLLSWGVDPLSQNRQHDTALHYAVWDNHTSFVRAFLAEVSSQEFPQGNGRDKLLEWCPELGTLRDHRGDVAIHLATSHSHLDCIKHLCMPEVVDLIGDDGRTALHYAIYKGDAVAVKYLVEHNADVNARQSHGLRNPPLIEALQKKDLVMVNTLLDGKADIEIADEDGWRPLHFAARDGSAELASRLLDLRCERQPQTRLGETPLLLAIRYCRPHITELFMKHGMIVSNIETLEGATYAYIAAYYGRLDILQELVKKDRNIIFKTTAAGVDALYAAAMFGHHTIVDFLIRSGMKPSGMGHFVDTPLARAAGSGYIKVVDMLLSMGAEVNQTDAWERTPLSRAVERGRLKIAHYLLEAGANPHIRDAIGFSAFDYCVNNSAMMDVLRPWQSIPRTNSMAQNLNDLLVRLTQCISRSARAMADLRRNSTYGYFEIDDKEWHLSTLRSFLFRLVLAPFTPPRLPAQKTHTAVPAKRSEILREWRIIVADSDLQISCYFCQHTLRRGFCACSICGSYFCEACISQLRLETQPHKHVKAWKELQQLERDVIPISGVLMDLAYEDSRIVREVLSQDKILRHWVLAKRQEYAKWRKRWALHHIRTVDFHGYNLVHTMARVLSHGQDRDSGGNKPASDALGIEQCEFTEKTRSDLTERWQDIFQYRDIHSDLDSSPCTHSSFLKGSRQRESLREPQVIFDSDGRLTSGTFDLLAQKYEDCLASGDLTFEQLQTRRFTDSIVQGFDNPNNGPEQSFGEECSLGADADSHDETSSLEGASDTTSDATNASVVSDMEDSDEAQIDNEELLEKLLVKRGSLMKESLLTDENDLVLETAWKFAQAIVYHDTPRQSLRDIAEQGSEWHTESI